ncbi:hypothetical protein AK85_14620 [Streptococcus pneumoniae B1598]|nr:hypothetical protein AK85_14620 [Streptococcus pneumoniae B1598]
MRQRFTASLEESGSASVNPLKEEQLSFSMPLLKTLGHMGVQGKSPSMLQLVYSQETSAQMVGQVAQQVLV